MSAIEGMVRRLRDRIAATLVHQKPVDFSTARAMAGNASEEATAALEQATEDFVATAIQQPQAMEDDDELPDFGDSVDL